MMKNTLADWLNATRDTLDEYIGPLLSIEHPAPINGITHIHELPMDSVMGSCLLLERARDTPIKICFLASDDILMHLSRKILKLSPTDPLDPDEIIDAIKEVINVISGGVKSRLNHQVEGGITLGLPLFVNNARELKEQEQALFEKITISGMPVFISVSN